MRSQKGSRRIVVRAVEYRWRATGNDGYISIGIWPANNTGPYPQVRGKELNLRVLDDVVKWDDVVRGS